MDSYEMSLYATTTTWTYTGALYIQTCSYLKMVLVGTKVPFVFKGSEYKNTTYFRLKRK